MPQYKPSVEDIEKVVLGLVERDGIADPRVLADEAADPEHPLHSLFDWDDTEAAAKWRVQQARQIVGRVRITVEGRSTPAHVHVTITGDSGQRNGYVPISAAMTDTQFRAQVLDDARAGLSGWRARVAAIDGLNPALKHLDQAIDELNAGE